MMKFEVYCDESRPDLLSSNKPPVRFMVIGSLWLRSDAREEYKATIHGLRDRHKVGGEFKWQKVSPSRQEFYEELADWFIEQGSNIRFRCIAVEHEKVNFLQYHENDRELGFYKFYYQMLHHWILDFNQYAIFCDFKQNRLSDRLHVLKQCLDASNLSSRVTKVQAVRSEESVLVQLSDVLTGAASARLNGTLKPNSAKENLVKRIESGLGHAIEPTWCKEPKFNVFQINLQGGW